MIPERVKQVWQRGQVQRASASMSQRRTSGSEGRFFADRSLVRKQKARNHSVRWWCSPRQERPSKWSSPSCSFNCW